MLGTCQGHSRDNPLVCEKRTRGRTTKFCSLDKQFVPLHVCANMPDLFFVCGNFFFWGFFAGLLSFPSSLSLSLPPALLPLPPYPPLPPTPSLPLPLSLSPSRPPFPSLCVGDQTRRITLMRMVCSNVGVVMWVWQYGGMRRKVYFLSLSPSLSLSVWVLRRDGLL